MPAKSEKQRKVMAIALKHPEQLYAKNRALADLPKKTLHDFAAKVTPKKTRGRHE